ncbi:DUF423 domain-containing protein [Rubrivirga sp. S365]|uniref:DUF423 domain-containing protein n=1 Tax=Rubrivirga sp. S365 TaxID=3076080 RepID=UPI0028C9D2EC|nr:DUF423 domain-containing protein [Rubrivirga sp. S365]MDT7855802.1 DUF423 domain-containing protein [Rubrivirga sp. S365]
MSRHLPTGAGRLVAAAAVVGGLMVAAGAFGAHALADAVPPARLDVWRTGAAYGQVHALAAVLAALVAGQTGARAALRAGWLFLGGVALFSGSLVALVLLDLPALGAVTPLGGVAFLVGWGTLAWAGLKER